MPASSNRNHLILLFTSVAKGFLDRALQRPHEGASAEIIAEDLAFVQELDRDGIDAVLAADFVGLNRPALESRSPFSPIREHVEPLTWLAALATTTRNIGLIGTISTQFNKPYNTARHFTSLDSISGGRSGWNVVTSFSGETNFGDQPLPPPHVRYAQAQEYLDVTTRLWRSWHDGFVRDRKDGTQVLNADHLQDLNHRGTFFQVEQALDLRPSPQREPVIVQAGSSEHGIDFAARNAELVFFAAEHPAKAKEYNAKLKGLAQVHGRERDDIRLILGVRIYLAETNEAAWAVYAQLVSEEDYVTARREILWELPDLDLDGLLLDDPLPIERFPSVEQIEAYGRRSSRPLIYRGWVANGHVHTVRGLLQKYHNARGHLELVGSVEEVADQLSDWYRDEVMDGLYVMGSNSYSLISDRLLPALVARGVRPPAADLSNAPTLRGRLGTRRNPVELEISQAKSA